MHEYDNPKGETPVFGDRPIYMTCLMNGDVYGINSRKPIGLKLIGLKQTDQITQIPNASPEIAGVIKHHGEIVLVVDLHRKLGFESVYDPEFCIVAVLAVNDHSIGVILDGLGSFIDISSFAIGPPAGFVAEMDEDFVRGVVNINGTPVILLNIGAVLFKNA